VENASATTSLIPKDAESICVLDELADELAYNDCFRIWGLIVRWVVDGRLVATREI